MWPELLLKGVEIIWNGNIQIDFWEENWSFYRVFVSPDEFFEKYSQALKVRAEWLEKLESARFRKRVIEWTLTDIYREWEDGENIPYTPEMAQKELDEIIPKGMKQFWLENYL